jgi:hypothetical protein
MLAMPSIEPCDEEVAGVCAESWAASRLESRSGTNMREQSIRRNLEKEDGEPRLSAGKVASKRQPSWDLTSRCGTTVVIPHPRQGVPFAIGVVATSRDARQSAPCRQRAERVHHVLMPLSSRAAAVVGPLVWSITVDILEPAQRTAIAYRAAVFTVVPMFAASLVLLRRVPISPVRPDPAR